MPEMKCCILEVDDRIFSKEAILKTSYLFVDEFYIHLSYSSPHGISIEITPKPDSDMTDIDQKFGNELIAQMVRYQLSISNRGMRDLILGRALYSTCIDREVEPIPEDNDVLFPSLDEITVDWFEKNEESNSLS